MRWMGTTWTLAALVAAATTVSAQTAPPSDAHIQELMKEAAARLGRQAQPSTTPAPAAGAQGNTAPTVRLTLDDAVKFALERNLDIAVQRLNPEINDISVARVRAFYYPALTSTLNTASTTTPASTTIAGSSQAGAPIVTGLSTYNAGIAENVPWAGGAFALAFNNNRQTSNSQNNLYNPKYNTNWSASYTQPLLRNFGTDITRQSLQVTKLNRDVSDTQLRATITNTLSNVREAYWNYVFAVQATDVAQQSVDLADQLVKDNQTRLEVGTMAPIDVVTAQSQAATARQNLVASQSTMYTNELTLKRLICSGTTDPNWNAHLDPVDRPEFRPEAIDIPGAIRRALSERTDLDIAKKDIEMNRVTLSYLQNQLKPQADFVGTYGLIGVGGSQLLFEQGQTNVNRTPIGSIPGGYFNALSSLFTTNFPTWTAQINFSYPIGLSTQQASVARARVQLSQVQAQMKTIELQVAMDVTNAAITAQTNAERVQAAQAARELAQKTMEAEQSKFEVGMSTNYNVILTQRDLATAQINELQAILNYRISLVELERLQQTTLQSLNVTVLSTQ